MNIEITNMYRNNEYGCGYDCPMHYYTVTCDGEIVGETDWDYGFADAEMASTFMEIYYPGKQFTIIISG